MSQQLVVGKYKFYPYEPAREHTLSVEDLAELCKKLATKKNKRPRRKGRAKE